MTWSLITRKLALTQTLLSCNAIFCLLIAICTPAIAQEKSPTVSTTRSAGRDLSIPKEEDSFHFVIYGDRTSGVPEGLKVLEQAVRDTNLLAPDLVMTIGDLVQGYNETPQWLEQAAEYKAIMDKLDVRWFPTAGNHDVYWRGEGKAPQGQHESNYEEHFGPLWYTFKHKNAGFIVLYTDEGDPATNEKGFGEARLQNMSEKQLEFLRSALKTHASADHVFVFMHHPRWIGGGYQGSNWDTIHQTFKEAGNVTAVFAGHIHSMRGDGQRDGIRYYTLATTGGNLSADIPDAGLLHHINVVRVRNKEFNIASIPVGSIFDPNRFSQKYLDKIRQVRNVTAVETSNDLILNPDSSAAGKLTYELKNDSPLPIEMDLTIASSLNDWSVTPASHKFELAPGASKSLSFNVRREANNSSPNISIPQLLITKSYKNEEKEQPIVLPTDRIPLPMKLSSVPVDYFRNSDSQCLVVKNAKQALRVENGDLKLHDGPFTVEGWFSPDQISGSRAAVAKTQGSEFAIFVNDGIPQFDVHLDGKYVSAKGKEPIQVNQWTHLAGVFDGKNVTIYVNGKQAGQKAGSGKRTTNELPLFLGADPNEASQPTRPLTGKVDELRITASAVYDKDFTPERRLVPVENTVLMLNLDRLFGPFVLDQSNSAVHTTLNPGAQLEPVLAP